MSGNYELRILHCDVNPFGTFNIKRFIVCQMDSSPLPSQPMGMASQSLQLTIDQVIIINMR